ncbi:MAG: bifunctional nuclease family protein [Nitrospirales bacterium]
MRSRCSILLLVLFVVLGWYGPSLAQAPLPVGQIQIEDVSVLMSEMGPVVLLKAHGRVVPIFVDPTVAGSIDGALRGQKFSRPLSHDLMHTILLAYGGSVTHVKIKLKKQIYYGELSVVIHGDLKVFDSRSSDAIALAIHFDAPIYVEKELFDQADQEPSESVDAQLL